MADNSWTQMAQHVLNELKRLNDATEKNAEQLTEIKISTVENTESLKLHMHRTKLNEQHIRIIEGEFRKRIEPVEDHIKFVQKSAKILIPMIGLPGAIYYILNIIKMLTS